MFSLRGVGLSSLILAVNLSSVHAQAPAVRELRTQKVGDVTYFQVRFENPKDWKLPPREDRWTWWRISKPDLSRLPHLVPQDDKTRDVYPRPNFIENDKNSPLTANSPIIENMEFCGKVTGAGEANLLLLYPTADDGKRPKDESYLLTVLRERGSWAEVEVKLDLTKAVQLEAPKGGFKREVNIYPDRKDLEGQWAASLAARFAVLEALTSDFGFYGFARETTSRMYKVPAPSIARPWDGRDAHFEPRHLYEITTGTTAITESLALRRMREPNFRDKGARTVDINKVEGVTIAEHPWVKMMGKNKPAEEPLAKLVPHDNYYLHFKSIVKFLDAGELFDQWGTALSRAFDANSRDNHLKERLEQQILLKGSKLTRLFGPAVVKSLAMTGSDPYIREGSDLTVIFHVAKRETFLAANKVHIDDAKKKFKDLAESKSEHQKIAIESFTTPLREVSLHRAIFDDYIVYSNSPAGVRRVIDTYKGKIKPLADSLDFQYMRTVFRLDDKEEDGFLFLSDPFIRNLVGPATRIKERRRLEGLTSLYMVTHGAMYHGWQTGKMPTHHNEMIASTGLKPEQIFSPDGNGAFWDAEKKVGISDVYNTLHFATPLIEIPIDKVTENERAEYENFRRQYMGLWRQFFDPIGMRFSLKDKEVKWETYILPLVQLSEYNRLRQLAGDGALKLDPGMIGSKALLQYFMHISPKADERRDAQRWIGGFNRDIGLAWLGDWFTIRVDDSPIYQKFVELEIRRDLEPGNRGRWDFDEELRLIFQMPITVGFEIKNPLVFAGVLTAVKKEVSNAAPDMLDWGPLDKKYKDVTIVQIKAKRDILGMDREDKKREPFRPSLYYATIGDAFYLSLSVEPIKDLIDRWADKQEGIKKGKYKEGDKVDVNASLHLGLAAAVQARDFLRLYLEWEAHRRTMANNTLLYALFRSGVLGPESSAEQYKGACLRYLGFEPVSPDNAPFLLEKKTDEVINKRHGSIRKPVVHAGVEPNSPNGKLLEQFRSIRADLKFREDGVHTTITFQRNDKK